MKKNGDGQRGGLGGVVAVDADTDIVDLEAEGA